MQTTASAPRPTATAIPLPALRGMPVSPGQRPPIEPRPERDAATLFGPAEWMCRTGFSQDGKRATKALDRLLIEAQRGSAPARVAHAQFDLQYDEYEALFALLLRPDVAQIRFEDCRHVRLAIRETMDGDTEDSFALLLGGDENYAASVSVRLIAPQTAALARA